MLWHPLSESCLRNPPQRLEIFSITGPYAIKRTTASLCASREPKGSQAMQQDSDRFPIYLHVSLKIEEIDPLPVGPVER